MTALSATVAGTVEDVAGAFARAHVGWLAVALGLHVCGQLARGIAWSTLLGPSFPDVCRRRACSWYLCGAGLSGVLSGRGADCVRMVLAKRELPAATWPTLTGSVLAELSSEAILGLFLALVALAMGISALSPPSPWMIGLAVAACAVIGTAGARSSRVRRLLDDVGRGARALRDPRLYLLQVLPWQCLGRVLRLAAVGCFLHAFELPVSIPVVITVCAVYGSGNALPIPGAGTAAAAAALLVAVPAVAGQTVDSAAVGALVIVQPVLLTAVGVSISLCLLARLLSASTPAALLRAVRALVLRPAPTATVP